MESKSARWLLCLVGSIAIAAFTAGCGSNDDSGGSSDVGSIGKSASAKKREAAVTAGKESGGAAGDPVAVPKKTVGVIEAFGAAEAIQRTTAGITAGAKVLGWTVKTCDAQGDPTKMASCASSLISQRVDVIMGEAIEAAPVKAQLTQAKSKGIPWINTTGPVLPDPLIESQATYDENTLGKTLGDYIATQIGGKGQVATTTIKALYALRLRSDAMVAALKSKPDIDVVDIHDITLSDPVADGRRWASTMLTRYPDLRAIGLDSDAEPPGVVPVVAQKFPGKQFPDRPLVTAPFGNLAHFELIRKGQLDAVAEVPLEATGWIALDRAAAFFARDTALPKEAASGYPIDLLPVTIVDKKNVPQQPKKYFEPSVDFVTFFTTKWGTEYKGLT
jgi:ABC-type sugar transport system substrate-binding protein